MSRSTGESARVFAGEGGLVRRFHAAAIAAGLAITYRPIRVLQKGVMYLIQM